MFELKPLHFEAIPAALEKAKHYRLLNEPGAAESICHDILNIDPDNQQARVILLLAMTDRFAKWYTIGDSQIREVLADIRDEYERLYYSGIVCERRAKANLSKGSPGTEFDAYEWLRQAMTSYEQAESLRPAEHDDATLRWNACARIIMRNQLSPRTAEAAEPYLE